MIISGSESETKKIGAKIAAKLAPGDIVCLYGDLGSGKTVLVKGIARGLGADESRVTSSSFILMREYQGRKLPLYHFDLYRLEEARNIAALGYEEYFYGSGVTVIEWAERLGPLVPSEYLRVDLSLGKSGSERYIKVSGQGARYKKIAEKTIENSRH